MSIYLSLFLSIYHKVSEVNALRSLSLCSVSTPPGECTHSRQGKPYKLDKTNIYLIYICINVYFQQEIINGNSSQGL